jgi:3D (Asp-Asp-Asp) domain-containing protein
MKEYLHTSTTSVSTEAQGLEVRLTEELVKFRVTAYCKRACCCGDWSDGFFADGTPAVGLAVAAPKRFKFGTTIIIPGYGEAVVRDRGGAIKGNRLDVFFATHQEALNWGVNNEQGHNLECEVLP